MLDSFPVAVCDNIRIARCRLIKDERLSRQDTKQAKVFLRSQSAGHHNRRRTADGVLHLARQLPRSARFGTIDLQNAELVADAAYTNYEWEDHLREAEQIRLQVPRKSNSTRAGEPFGEHYKQIFRKYIETVFGEIQKMFPKKIYATTLDGFIIKISLFLFAYQLDKAFINN